MRPRTADAGGIAARVAGMPPRSSRSAPQQPGWRHDRAFDDVVEALSAAPPLVSAAEVLELRLRLAAVADGRAMLLQTGDCSEDMAEVSRPDTDAKARLLDELAGRLEGAAGRPVLRVGRMGGQFAKPRSQPYDSAGGRRLPAFRGHMINSEVATEEARRHDPHRMMLAYQASAGVIGRLRETRLARGVRAAGADGPWASHEALVLDYETALTRWHDESRELYLASTHLPWIGERTRRPDGAHAQLMAAIENPVGCKIGPTAGPDDVAALCEVLDPNRLPGRLVLISRMGAGLVGERLESLVRRVRAGGHPVVWLCDPMHGNTRRTHEGLKTRRLGDMIDEAVQFRRVLEDVGVPVGGLHLETAVRPVTECVGGNVVTDNEVPTCYESLCDPRLNADQAHRLIDSFL
ncbi:3-deoxy-7-phosphoheptulonate synthase [Spirillospora sp. NPDC047279]|uniref:3-deoxy-7-phosphoheptulonate synthase n=1 Tax=Spirillospora sp. NPDC047279 TaxID=3155478 RepID=UPI0034045AD5